MVATEADKFKARRVMPIVITLATERHLVQRGSPSAAVHAVNLQIRRHASRGPTATTRLRESN